MRTATKPLELEKEDIENSTPNRSQIILLKPSSTKTTAPKASSLGWWSGIGVIVLCGICCSLPLLGGGLAIGGTGLLAFLNVTGLWLWLAVALTVLLIVSLLIIRLRRSNRVQTESGPGGLSMKSCTCENNGASCPSDHSCGCGK